MSKKKLNLSIIDSDAFLYTCSSPFKDQVNIVGVAGFLSLLDIKIKDILKQTKADVFIILLGAKGGKNYRYDLAYTKPYKNRKKLDWQKYFVDKGTDHLIDKWSGYAFSTLEADDAVSIAYQIYKDEYNLTMCYVDKDLIQIGDHTRFNFGKDYKNGNKYIGFVEYTQFDATYNLYHQMMTGDGADNIPGLPGVGKVAATTVLMHLDEESTEVDFYESVKDKYITYLSGPKFEWTEEVIMKYMMEQYSLLWMLDFPLGDYDDDVIIPIKVDSKKYKIDTKEITRKELTKL